MKLWKIFAVISAGLVLGLAYSYLSQEADLSVSLRRHPSDGLPGTGNPQPILPTNENIGSHFALAQNTELTRNPPNEEVRMRVRFQKRAGPHKRPSDPLGTENEGEDFGRPGRDVSKQKAVTWTDLLKEESNQRKLPEQTVQRHKRGADWIEHAIRREESSGDNDEDAARSEEVAVEVAEDAEMAAEEADSALEGEEDGDFDESGRQRGDELEESAEHEPARDKMARSSGRKGNLRESYSLHLSAGGAEDDKDAVEDAAVEDASAGAEDDEEEEDLPRLSQASVRGRGQAGGKGSLGQPNQADSRVKGTLLQASNAAGKVKQQPKTQRARAKAAGETGRSRSAAIGKGVDKAAKNKTAAFRPALLGFNLTWEMLEGEEELYRQDVASPVALGAGLQGQHDRPLIAQLTAALAKSRSRDGVVIVTWASAAYLDFLRNWVHHLTLLEVENFLIGAMDGIVAEYLRQENIPYFDMQAAMYSHMEGHLMKPTKEARMLAFNKIGVAQTLNAYGLNALLCDADVVWLRDPSDFFSGLEEADILVATDGLGVANAKDDDGLESPEAGLRSQMSTAILFLRHGRGSRNFLDAWDSSLRRNTSRTEQEAFNAVARAGVKPLKTHPDNWRVFYGMGRTVTFGILPASGFANGHSYFVQRLYEVMRVSPYAVHMSYVFGGVAAKRNRLREEQIWLDDPDYYDQKRLLTLDIHVPAIPDNFERLKNDYMVELHLKLMQHQLDQLVVGFAMAMTLNRTLVMPRLVCFCDRFWSPLERCRAPGAVRTQLPFVCPLDHILRPSHFGDNPSLYGPPIAFREHSFWDHPDTPAELKDNQVEVVVAAGESSNSAKKVGNQLVIPRDLSDADLWKTLEPYVDIKVLMVKNVTGIFRGFAEKSAADGFWRRMAHITGIWCCNYDGGIAYRMAPRLNSTISASL